jgi:farnesol dehydrogenase
MRIFVTGATGYIGGALCHRLAAEGHEVRALVRATSDPAAVAALRGAGAATFTGDVTDRLSMREGMSGADRVVHAAADLAFDGPPERMRRVNVEGSDNVASLAYKLGVGGLLSISSIAWFGGSPADGTPADEGSAPLLPLPSRYCETKHAGEQAIRRWAEQGLPVVTVHPSLVYGPPGKREGSNAVLRQLVLRRLPALVGADRLTSWVYLDDVVEALVLRLGGAGAPGGRYLLAGDTVALGELARRVCRLAGVAPPPLRLPLPVARAAVALLGPLYRLRGRRPPLLPEQLRSLARNWAFDDTHARHDLGWTPRTLDQGLPPTVEYLKT